MAIDDNQRYGRNRNVWRKVYSYGKQKPKIITFIDEATGAILQIDSNQTLRHRDYYKIDDNQLQPGNFNLPWEYDEGIIGFNNEAFVTGSFNFAFSGNPFVVYTLEAAVPTSSLNVNVYGMNVPSTSSFVVGTSAPLSGSVRYRAVYSQFSPTYPVTINHGVTPKVNSPYTASFMVYAGEIDAVGQTDYTASYSLPAGGILEYRAMAHDSTGDGSSDVALINQEYSISGSLNTISAPLTNKIHFMVTRK